MAAITDTPVLRPPTTDRRALFSAAALLGVAGMLPGTVPASAAAFTPDAELIELCARWRVAADRYILIVNRVADIFDVDQTDADRALKAEIEDQLEKIEDRIFELEATTLAGVQAKAGVLDYMAEAMDLTMTKEQAASLIANVMALGSDA